MKGTESSRDKGSAVLSESKYSDERAELRVNKLGNTSEVGIISEADLVVSLL